MATTTVITDDLDGSTEARTVEFSFDGTNFEIDLSEENFARFEEALSEFVKAAREVKPAARRAAPANTPKPREYDIAELRGWAAANGMAVASKGRPKREVVEAFLAAKKGEQKPAEDELLD